MTGKAPGREYVRKAVRPTPERARPHQKKSADNRQSQNGGDDCGPGHETTEDGSGKRGSDRYIGAHHFHEVFLHPDPPQPDERKDIAEKIVAAH